MIIFEGKYSWDGKKKDDTTPVSWWPGACHMKIVDISKKNPDVFYIKPYICLMADTSGGVSVRSCIDNLSVEICLKFGLKINKVLWVEGFPESEKYMDIAIFDEVAKIGMKKLYSVSWRPALKNEIRLVKTILPIRIHS